MSVDEISLTLSLVAEIILAHLLGGEGGVRSAPKLPDRAVLLGEITVDDTVAEAVHEFVALGHLKGSEESVIAAGDSIGSDNHFLLADSHNLSSHISKNISC